MLRVTMLHCPIWEETIDIHRLLFLEQNLCCADMRCLSLTLYIDVCLFSLSHSQWTPAFGWQDMRLSQPQWQQWLPISWEWMWRQRKTNYCKCTHCMLCLIIMCNVAALTFYATIYEDICCICNKSREKHVLGTASTAGSLCLFDLWVLWLPGQARIYNHYGLIKNNLTLFVLYASVVLVHQSCSSFIVLKKKNIWLSLCFTRVS